MACILVLSILFAFSACKNDVTKNEQSSTTTSTTEKENTTEDNTTKSDGTTASSGNSLAGEWACDEIVTPKVFYADFYNPEITKTNIELRTIYKFNDNDTFTIKVSISNISDVRKEYRKLMVAAGRANIESQGKVFTTDDVLYYENYADKILKEICTEQKGVYVIEKDKIIYTLNGETFYETFVLNGNKLTITGASNSDEGYPITMIKI